jgi:serine/threonine protein phosphatase PrpC
MQQNIEVDLFTEELKSGVSVIFCSDGLWEMVRDNIIRDVMLNTDNVQTACRQLVEIANRNGGADNISVIAIKVTV